MFFTKKEKKAFTLVELMVVMAVIVLIALSFNTTNLTKLTDRQKIQIFTNKLITNIESLRNSSLIWKWADSNLTSTYLTEITLTDAWSWSLIVKYNTWATSTLINNSEFSLTPWISYSIKEIRCLRIDNSDDWVTASWVVSIVWANLSLSWCPVTSRKLKITTKFLDNEQDFTINVVNWLVIKNKKNSL